MRNRLLNLLGVILLLVTFQTQFASATNGTGVVTVTSNGGSCIGFTAAVGAGPDNWEVVQGGSYTMTISGVTECSGDAITVFVQSSESGNFCFNAYNDGNGNYTGNFSVPNPACNTMPISYKCGGSQPCNNSSTFNADGPSGNNKVHLRASNFNGSCVKTSDDTECSGVTCTLSLSETHTNVSCHDGSNGSIDITASGAQGSVTYVWNNGATTQDRSGLSAGTYTVTATDGNSCQATRTVTITAPSSSVGVSMSKTDVTITNGNNGTATANPSGGTPGYTFSWSTGATTGTISGLTAGTYTVTVSDSHGCSASNNITLTQPQCSIELSETHVNVSCHDGSNGSINITASGAQGSVSYLWNNGATTQNRSGLSAGTYTVTATDAGSCAASKTITITTPSTSVGVSMSKTDVTITNGNNGTATANPSGGTPGYTYSWSTGATIGTISGLTAGTYTVTVSDSHGCSATNNITLTQPQCSIELSETHVNVSCLDGSSGSINITASGAQGSVSYLWNDGATTQNRSSLLAGTYTVTATDAGACNASKSITITQPESSVSVSMSKTDVTITNGNNGTATANPSGGTPGYTFSWSTGATTNAISGLTIGTYSVTVTDSHGCSASNQITLTQPGCSIQMSAEVINISCHDNADGSIAVTTTGAQGSVSYLWNDGATTEDRSGLAAGTYTVTATDGGSCSATLTRTISQPEVLGMSGVVGNVTTSGGHDGSIDVTVSGGTSPYSYLWNDGVTTEDRSGLGAGTYTVSVTDAHNCPASQSFTITQPCSIQLTATCKKPKCFGGSNGSINVTASGAIGSVTYLWNDGVTTEDRAGLSAGTYTVTATDEGGCSATIIKQIKNPSQLLVTETHQDVTSCQIPNGSIDISISGGNGAKRTYLWNDGATTQDRTGLAAGTYTVTVKDAHQCPTSLTVVINPAQCKGANAGINDGSMKIYPNPANDIFNVEIMTNESSDKEYSLYVENTLGQIVYSVTSSTTSGNIKKEVSFNESVSEGMYMVHVIIGSREFTQPMIIQHNK